jgi:hypothetical protein
VDQVEDFLNSFHLECPRGGGGGGGDRQVAKAAESSLLPAYLPSRGWCGRRLKGNCQP